MRLTVFCENQSHKRQRLTSNGQMSRPVRRLSPDKKASLEHKSPKTVNNVLNVLSVLLKRAVEWEVIERMPCTVKLLRVDKGKAAFHDVRRLRTTRRRGPGDRSAHAADRSARR